MATTLSTVAAFPREAADPAAFLDEGGEMGALMRAKDWSRTPLGAPERWPQSLRTAVALMLRSKQPIFIGWGGELISLYNDGYIPICGSKHPEGLGLPMSQLWREIWDSLEPINVAVLRGESQWFEDMPFALAGRDRTEPSYFSFSYTPLLGDDGRIAGIYCAAIETTEKVRLERHRARALERQHRMFMQAPGFICTLRGPEHVFEFVNDAHRRLFNRADAVDRPVREAFPDLAGQGFYEQLDRVYATGERYIARDLPVRLRASPDEPEQHRRLDFIYAPILDEEGKVSGIFCEGYDVTESFAAQAALREREEQLRLATDAAEVGLWDVDLVTDTLFWPARVKAMFGISPDVAVSMADFYAGLHPADREHVSAAFAAACDPAVRSIYDVEFRTVGKEDGRIRWVAAKGRGIFDEAGRCVRVIGTAINISDRKGAELALLENEERLRAADRRKDEFLAIMGHELRNPLAPLVTAAHLIRLRGGRATEKEMGILDRQLRQMTKIVTDLLDASRAMRENVELAPKVMEVGEVLASAVDLASPFIEERRHALTIEVPDRGMPVSADPERMAQVFGNLLHNAAKYTPPGGRIRLRVASRGDEIEVTVEDSGQGIPPEMIEGVFDLFAQAEAGREQGGGLGIGLAVARKLVQAHGGQIRANSEGPGRGSRFTVRLPRAVAPAQAQSPASTPPRKTAVVRRVLVADDNRDTVELIETLLTQSGHELRCAFDGPSALRICEELQPDIVFLDIGLPGMDGYEVARRMRALPWGKSIRIVAVSGYVGDADRARAIESGCDVHLAKPFDIDGLSRIVDDV
jgi:PAS domain S-box-containing protein